MVDNNVDRDKDDVAKFAPIVKSSTTSAGTVKDVDMISADLPDSSVNATSADDITECILESKAEIYETKKLSEISSTSCKEFWPPEFVEDFSDDTKWPQLEPNNSITDCQQWIRRYNKVAIRTITWNLQANSPPSLTDVQQKLMPHNKFHMYIIGSEECENSIAYSAINSSKDKWLDYLENALGPMYIKIRSHTLQAIHITLFAHIAVAPFISDVSSAAVPTGLGNTLVGFSFLSVTQ